MLLTSRPPGTLDQSTTRHCPTMPGTLDWISRPPYTLDNPAVWTSRPPASTVRPHPPFFRHSVESPLAISTDCSRANYRRLKSGLERQQQGGVRCIRRRMRRKSMRGVRRTSTCWELTRLWRFSTVAVSLRVCRIVSASVVDVFRLCFHAIYNYNHWTAKNHVCVLVSYKNLFKKVIGLTVPSVCMCAVSGRTTGQQLPRTEVRWLGLKLGRDSVFRGLILSDGYCPEGVVRDSASALHGVDWKWRTWKWQTK